jgi:hypothetical protein
MRPFSRYMVFGRRRYIRRKEDKRNHLYVDRYDHSLLIALLLVVLLSVLDGYFTIFHVDMGAQEINPIMNLLLGYGDRWFFILKYLLTVIGVFIFCIYQNLLVVRAVLAFVLVFYVGVLANHLFLMLTR